MSSSHLNIHKQSVCITLEMSKKVQIIAIDRRGRRRLVSVFFLLCASEKSNNRCFTFQIVMRNRPAIFISRTAREREREKCEEGKASEKITMKSVQ